MAAFSLLPVGMPVAMAGPPTTRGQTSKRDTDAGKDSKKGDDKKPSPRSAPTAPKTRGGPTGGPASPELTGDEGGALAFNACRRQPKGSKFRITLPKEAELDDLVNWMMSVSCQKFIWDPKVRSGKVTILSPEPVTIEESYAAFYAALQTMGLTVEPSGKYFKIVETAEAKSRTLPVYGPAGRAPANDRYVTQLFRTRGGNTKQVADLLNKLKTKNGSVDTVGDLVILTDTGSSVRRLMRIVRQVDDPSVSGDKIFFYQLRDADPEQIAEIIREIFGEKEKAAAKKGKKKTGTDPSFSRVIVDERTGTLIIVTQASDYAVIRRLIEQLDVPMAGTTSSGRIHVVKLRNADPEEVAQVLTQLGSGSRQGGGEQGAARGGRRQQAQPQQGRNADVLAGDIRVTADPATRSLVIMASQNDFRALQTVIEALDEPRKQVYLEVYILELAVNNRIEGGAGAHFGSDFNTGQGQGLGFVASAPDATTNSVVLNPAILNGLAAGVLGPEIPGSGQFLGVGRDIPAFGVVIQAVQSNNDVNLVAEPHIYTADNKEASIEVGRNVPTPGGVTGLPGAQGGGFGVPFQSIQRQDVTLNLKVTPHVNDQQTVSLDIELENNDIESIDPTLGVTTTKRRLQLENVVARDDQPVVLGGLVQEVEREGTAQVPGLGQIPLLGWLFKRKTKSKEKINLLMILVPHIIETPDDVRRIHKRRMDERMEFLERESAFKRRDLSVNVNYRKKSGLLSAINHEASRMTSEEIALQIAEEELQQEVITGEIGLSPRTAAEDDEPETSSTKKPSTPKPRRKGKGKAK